MDRVPHLSPAPFIDPDGIEEMLLAEFEDTDTLIALVLAE